MDSQPDSCPQAVGELAESYCLNRLSQEQARVFEDHYLLCPQCARVVESTQEFLLALRAAAAASG